MAKYADFSITIARGEPIDLHIPITRKGNPVDITGWTNFNVFIKATSSADDVDALIDLNMTGDTPAVTILDGPKGLVEATVPAAATQTLENKPRTLYCDVYGTDETETTWTLARGKILIKNKATIKLPFIPTQIKGLKLWLRGDQGVYQDQIASHAAVANNDPVGGWKGPGATHVFGQSTLNKRPVKHANSLNGLPTVLGDGTGSYLQGPNLSGFLKNEEFTLFMVAKGFVNDASGAGVNEWPPFMSDQDGSFALAMGGQSPDDENSLGGSVGLYTFDGLIDAQVVVPFDPAGWVLIEARHGPELSGGLYDHIIEGDVGQFVLSENNGRTSLSLKNDSTADLWLHYGGTADEPGAFVGQGIRVAAGATYSVTTNVLNDSLSIAGHVTGQKYTLIQGTGVIGVRVDGFADEATQICGQAMNKVSSKVLASPTYLFGNPDGRPFLHGEIAELLMWDVHLEPADKAKVRGYMHARWGVPGMAGDVTADQ